MLSHFVTMPTIKVSERTYRLLNELAGKMRAREKAPVSTDEVIGQVIRKARLTPSSFSGSWEMGDSGAKAMTDDLRRFWSSWKFRES